ncbi:uncharacterized protein LOC117644370 [Thrips palmi]|uniref:Uncharacterized protein LOC117644370 n=1 Tax=Thrips palmi TaxID=161013 RepID=A0A6P8ZLZ2_THRPL|nr:uncharacterized protein LOC117644370 [Thrips palmi]
MGCTQLTAGVVFVTWLRTFQYHRVTTQVLVTLQRSRFDLIGYFAMYLVSPFKTFSESALAILAIALGEMRSDVILTAHSGTGPVYFLLLIFIVIFVFHNMFFVILSYNYDSVREERSQLDRGLNFIAFIYNGYLNLTKPNRPPDPQEDMERRLMRCGFSPASLQTFRSFLKPAQVTATPNYAPSKVFKQRGKKIATEILTSVLLGAGHEDARADAGPQRGERQGPEIESP